MSDEACSICHIEIPAPDLEAAKAFYAQVFGWRVWDAPGMPYGLWKAGDGASGGFDPSMTPSAEGGFNVYLKAADIPAKLAQVAAAGGRVLKEKTRISDEHGFYATFLDPNGNRLSLWSRA